MEDDGQPAEVWIYERNCDNLDWADEAASKLMSASFWKHWAVVLIFMDPNNPEEEDFKVCFEAFDKGGYLVAQPKTHRDRDERRWRDYPGFSKMFNRKLEKIRSIIILYFDYLEEVL